MPSVTFFIVVLIVVMLNVVTLNVVMLSVVTLNVAMLSVTAPLAAQPGTNWLSFKYSSFDERSSLTLKM